LLMPVASGVSIHKLSMTQYRFSRGGNTACRAGYLPAAVHAADVLTRRQLVQTALRRSVIPAKAGIQCRAMDTAGSPLSRG
jgi:hypothetical protein